MKPLRIWIGVLAVAACLTMSQTALPNPVAALPQATQQARAQQTSKYPTVAMHRGKQGQDKSAGVVYLNDQQREMRRIVIKNGLLYDHTGQNLLTTRSKHRNQNNYVMDASGTFYLFDEFTHPEIRHSSIFAGGPVAGAGNIAIENGQVTYLDSDSGHYPSTQVFENVQRELAAQGIQVGGGQHKLAKAGKQKNEEPQAQDEPSVKEGKKDKKGKKKGKKNKEHATAFVGNGFDHVALLAVVNLV